MSDDKMNVEFDVGEAMSYEDMMKFRRMDADKVMDQGVVDRPAEKGPHPHLFEDEPLGQRKVALVSILSCHTKQRHADGNMYMKVKGVCNTISDAARIGEKLDNEGCDVFAMELYKFTCVPPPADIKCTKQLDDVLEESLVAFEKHLAGLAPKFKERKEKMLQAIKKQDEIKMKIDQGELPPDALDSSCVVPEEVINNVDELQQQPQGDWMKSDRPLSPERYVVLAIADLAGVECPLVDRVIVKLCAVFEQLDDAESHVKELKKESRYKAYDVAVAHMYEWLQMPPPIELLDKVTYNSSKLTEVLGERKKRINVRQLVDAEPQCDMFGANSSTEEIGQCTTSASSSAEPPPDIF